MERNVEDLRRGDMVLVDGQPMEFRRAEVRPSARTGVMWAVWFAGAMAYAEPGATFTVVPPAE